MSMVHSKLTTRTVILLWSVGCILVGGIHYCAGRLPSQKETYVAALSGSFVAHQGESIDPSHSVPYWSSDARGGPGSVVIGPFPAPDRLKFAVRGHPEAKDSKIYLELESIRFRIPLTIANPGRRWVVFDHELPPGWRGRLITLNACVGSAGELAISQPFGYGTGETRQYGLMETVTAWLANGLLYGAIFVTVSRLLSRREIVRPCWVPLTAYGVMAVVGYLAFWSYFASPSFGRLVSAAIFLATLLANVLPGERMGRCDDEWLLVGYAVTLIGVLYIGIFHLFPAHRDFYDLASNRFIVGLPGDNRLPFDFADSLYHGQRLKELGAGWLSSDRPPLQEGWQLIAWPVTELLGFSDGTASATASVWFQFSWAFALYGLLRSLGMPVRRAIFWLAAASLNGFFLLHTLFTWPKLSAGAFVCGVFGMWVLGGCRSVGRGRLIGAIFAALACLSHGGAAFTLIPLLPWVAWRCFKGEFPQWILAAFAFALTVAPWLAYQHYFAPPGDRLLKIHLAGQFELDDKPVWRTISNAYRGLSWKEVIEKKASNLAIVLDGEWSRAADWSAGSADSRRSDEYYHTFRAMGWWNLAVPLSLASLFGISFRRRVSGISRQQWALGAWIALSIATWCLLMFTQTFVHQGSFAVMIAMFAFYTIWIEAAGRWCLPCMASLQGYTLASTWMPANTVVNGPPTVGAVTLIALAVAAGATLMLRPDVNGSAA